MIGHVIILILQMRKLKFRKLGNLPRTHTKWKSQDLNPGGLTPERPL